MAMEIVVFMGVVKLRDPRPTTPGRGENWIKKCWESKG